MVVHHPAVTMIWVGQNLVTILEELHARVTVDGVDKIKLDVGILTVGVGYAIAAGKKCRG